MKTLKERLVTETKASGIALKDLQKGDTLYLAVVPNKNMSEVVWGTQKISSISLGEDHDNNDDDDEGIMPAIGGLVIKTKRFPRGINEPFFINAWRANEVGTQVDNEMCIATDKDALRELVKMRIETYKRDEAAFKSMQAIKPTKGYKAEYDALVDEYDHENGPELDAKYDAEFKVKLAALKKKYGIKD